jgi:hypothetical protein
MLTGVEIAGLVLGALPILISAVEQYKEGLHPIKIFFQKQSELDRFLRALDEQKTFLRLSLIELFGAELSSLTEEQIEALQDDSNDLKVLWEDEHLQAEVKQRLGLAYVPYMNNIDRMKEALEKLVNQKCLSIQSVTQVNPLISFYSSIYSPHVFLCGPLPSSLALILITHPFPRPIAVAYRP